MGKSSKVSPACPVCGARIIGIQYYREETVGKYDCGSQYDASEPPKAVSPCPQAKKVRDEEPHPI